MLAPYRFLGLIISKEQKTSEFRQDWIDELRASFVKYLTQINAIHDAVQVEYLDHGEKVDALRQFYVDLNGATFEIFLRINPEERLSKKLIENMNEFNILMMQDKDANISDIRSLERKYIELSQNILKGEWKRVKSGELTFRLSKYAALSVVIISVIAILIFSMNNIIEFSKNLFSYFGS